MNADVEDAIRDALGAHPGPIVGETLPEVIDEVRRVAQVEDVPFGPFTFGLRCAGYTIRRVWAAVPRRIPATT